MRKVKIPKSQIFCFALIMIVCIIAIVEALYYVMNPNIQDKENIADNGLSNTEIIDTNLVDNFNDVFQNSFKNTNTSEDVEKIDAEKDYIYTNYEKTEVNSGNYEIDVKIPEININSEEIKSYNEDIKQIFQDKAESILNGGSNRSVYSVDYEAFLNNNILSIVIRSTLKDGSNPQRVIIQTYCYNIKEMKKVEFSDIMTLKNLDTNTVQEKIRKQIQGKQEEAKALQQLGYSVYIRDLRSDRYDVENISNFFIDENNNVYVIYAYGNSSNTDVTDIVIF
ncbi:MAG: hypothetical protein KIC54_04725 [Clostridium sp.]|nr:hypothetical protein [Clostridium sp.]